MVFVPHIHPPHIYSHHYNFFYTIASNTYTFQPAPSFHKHTIHIQLAPSPFTCLPFIYPPYIPSHFYLSYSRALHTPPDPPTTIILSNHCGHPSSVYLSIVPSVSTILCYHTYLSPAASQSQPLPAMSHKATRQAAVDCTRAVLSISAAHRSGITDPRACAVPPGRVTLCRDTRTQTRTRLVSNRFHHLPKCSTHMSTISGPPTPPPHGHIFILGHHTFKYCFSKCSLYLL